MLWMTKHDVIASAAWGVWDDGKGRMLGDGYVICIEPLQGEREAWHAE